MQVNRLTDTETTYTKANRQKGKQTHRQHTYAQAHQHTGTQTLTYIMWDIQIHRHTLNVGFIGFDELMPQC